MGGAVCRLDSLGTNSYSSLEREEPCSSKASSEVAPVDPFDFTVPCCKGPPRCEVGSLCFADVVGLTDQECADVLLAQAAMRGDLNDIKRALGQGADVDSRGEMSITMGDPLSKRCRQVTPLMRAASRGHVEAVQCLLEARASLWKSDKRGWTPLCYAAAAGELKTARAILDASKSGSDRQKAILHHFKAQVLEQCEEAASEEDIQALKQGLTPGGFLARKLWRV